MLAPLLFWLAHWGAQELPVVEALAAHPFHRFVNRAMLVLAVAGLWPLLHRLELRSWQGLGWVWPGSPWRALGGGLALGFASVALAAAAVLAGGGRTGRGDLGLIEVVGDLVAAVLTGVVVAGLEETLFRGALQGGLRRGLGWAGAVTVGALAYAALHFLARVRWEGMVAWSSGFEVIFRMLAGFGDWRAIFPSFLNLTLAGLILGLAFEWTGNLCFSAGLHAGWVIATKAFAAATREVPGSATWLWGTGRLMDGWTASVPLLLSLLVLPLVLRGVRRQVSG